MLPTELFYQTDKKLLITINGEKVYESKTSEGRVDIKTPLLMMGKIFYSNDKNTLYYECKNGLAAKISNGEKAVAVERYIPHLGYTQSTICKDDYSNDMEVPFNTVYKNTYDFVCHAPCLLDKEIGRAHV